MYSCEGQQIVLRSPEQYLQQKPPSDERLVGPLVSTSVHAVNGMSTAVTASPGARRVWATAVTFACSFLGCLALQPTASASTATLTQRIPPAQPANTRKMSGCLIEATAGGGRGGVNPVVALSKYLIEGNCANTMWRATARGMWRGTRLLLSMLPHASGADESAQLGGQIQRTKREETGTRVRPNPRRRGGGSSRARRRGGKERDKPDF